MCRDRRRGRKNNTNSTQRIVKMLHYYALYKRNDSILNFYYDQILSTNENNSILPPITPTAVHQTVR
jgi:hypothetical protein